MRACIRGPMKRDSLLTHIQLTLTYLSLFPTWYTHDFIFNTFASGGRFIFFCPPDLSISLRPPLDISCFHTSTTYVTDAPHATRKSCCWEFYTVTSVSQSLSRLLYIWGVVGTLPIPYVLVWYVIESHSYRIIQQLIGSAYCQFQGFTFIVHSRF